MELLKPSAKINFRQTSTPIYAGGGFMHYFPATTLFPRLRPANRPMFEKAKVWQQPMQSNSRRLLGPGRKTETGACALIFAFH
jgi:hypothetical protein